MKKLIASAILAAIILSCFTACGKNDKTTTEDTSRVLYSDSDVSTNSESDTETDSNTTDKETDSEKKDSDSEKKSDTEKKSESEKKTESSKKEVSSKSETPKTVSSKATSSSETSSKDTSSKTVSSKAETDSDKGTDTNTDTNTDTDSATETDTTTDTQTDNTDDENDPIAPFDEDVDLGFSYGSSWINLYDNIENVVDSIGEPDEITDVGLGTLGLMKRYDYSSKGFVIIVSPNNIDNDYYMVHSLMITSTLVRTEKDVSIGSAERAIYDIYGKENCEHVDNTYVYHSKSGNEMLKFFIDDGYVSEILITTSNLF
ncbi:MAG: hypothetical protein VZR27_04135 [Acutalibacteraceae bacterium]|nr:hypothetical protein [Acutalibacteraceae bacterium]